MNPYDVLNVARDATTDEIKKRYRALARETHPDLNPGDSAAETRFKEVSVAYDILTDPERRRAFDEFGEISLEAGFDADRARESKASFERRFGEGDANAYANHFEFGDLDEILRNFGAGGMGQGRSYSNGPSMRMRGPDARSILELDFVEAIRGGERKLTIQRARAHGELASETITVRFPPGAGDGSELRIPGKGAEGLGGGPPGDLLVEMRVRPHPVFRKQGRDLEFDLPVTLKEAALGAEIPIQSLDSTLTLKVPSGTNSHARLRIRGHGVPGRGNRPAGDLYARIKVIMPKDLDDEARAAIDAIEQPDPRAELWP